MTRLPVLTLGCLIAMMATGCSPQPAGGGRRLSPRPSKTPPTAVRTGRGSLEIDSESDGFDPLTSRLSIAGAINETITFDLRMRAIGAPVQNIDVSLRPLRSQGGPIRGARLRLFRVRPVSVSHWPGWHVKTIDASARQRTIYDVVVPIDAPRGALPASLATGESLRLFAELHIGPRTAPGDYSTDVTIIASGHAVQTIPLSVTVWPFSLPDSAGVTLLTAFDHHAGTQQYRLARGPCPTGRGPPRGRLRPRSPGAGHQAPVGGPDQVRQRHGDSKRSIQRG